jgi:secreted Zn-dependent insulinase-like peptidase
MFGSRSHSDGVEERIVAYASFERQKQISTLALNTSTKSPTMRLSSLRREMHSSLISKIEKAKRYAQERDRIAFSSFAVTFRGDHDTYQLQYDSEKWLCGCPFFQTHGYCSHTLALQRILEGMMPADANVPLK